MPSKDGRLALDHIAENIALVDEWLSGMSFEIFSQSRLHLYAVTRALEIISEASRRLPQSLKDRPPEIPWVDVAGAGNVYRHDYEGIEAELIWLTATRALVSLRNVVTVEAGRHLR